MMRYSKCVVFSGEHWLADDDLLTARRHILSRRGRPAVTIRIWRRHEPGGGGNFPLPVSHPREPDCRALTSESGEAEF
jgi:hypothetical protein